MFKDNKELTLFFAVLTIGLFAFVISVQPVSDNTSGLAAKDFFDAKSRNDMYRQDVGQDIIRAEQLRRAETREVTAYLASFNEEVIEKGGPLEETPENFKLGVGGPKGTCLPVGQANFPDADSPGDLPWDPNGLGKTYFDSCYELVEDVTLEYPLHIAEDGKLDCMGHTLTLIASAYEIRLGHNAELANCDVIYGPGDSWYVIAMNSIISDSTFEYAYDPQDNMVRVMVVALGGLQMTNVEIENSEDGIGVQLQTGTGQGIENTQFIFDNVEVSGGRMGVQTVGVQGAEISMTDVDVTDTIWGLRLNDASNTFDNVRSCDNSNRDFYAEDPSIWSSSYVGTLEADVLNPDESAMYPGLDVSPCSTVVEVDGDVTILGPDGAGGNEDDDGPVKTQAQYNAVVGE